MAPNRTIKPSFGGVRDGHGASRDARLRSSASLDAAADAGHFEAPSDALSPASSSSTPASTAAKVLRDCPNGIGTTGIDQFHKVGGEQYVVFPHWGKHLRTSKPARSPSAAAWRAAPGNRGRDVRAVNTLICSAPVAERLRGAGKGRARKGREADEERLF